ncbi:MAG: hypothetical protein OSA38_01450 [Candidatus Poseidoniaceae archaeon]|nr:hypothetical protein [Candidatus Poseidoniaceae archaeon]
MEMKIKDIMTELGGAFTVTWLIMGITVWSGDVGTSAPLVAGLGMASLGGMLALGVAWMAFSGAHILPPVTWMHAMTSDDMTDQNMWMGTVIRLITQVVGAVLAIIMMSKLQPDFVTYSQAWPDGQASYEFAMWSVVGLLAAGAILGQIQAKAGSTWAMPIAVMAMATIVNFESAADMASMLMNGQEDAMAVTIPWLVDGLVIGVGALMGMKIDEMIANADSSEE